MLVADQPFVTASHLNALIGEYDAEKSQMYLAANDWGHGNPCLADRGLFDELLALTGDEGARALLRAQELLIPMRCLRSCKNPFVSS